jgi:L-2-hydroxyglutarate oxidase LhgO
MISCDFLVIGAGIIGTSIARELRARYPDASVLVIDKEDAPGAHASGRNSGVLHAGFYYTADSLKARFTREGNAALTAYCLERGLAINRCGKLVVARNEAEDRMLDELLRRGRANGVELEEVDEKQAREIEPRARTWRRAIFSPTTSSADPHEVLEAMVRDAEREGVRFRFRLPYRAVENGAVRAGGERIAAGYVINAAGLYADRIARDFGFSKHYTILPFKGLYLKSDEPAGAYRVHIYPVPDLKYPFLGVHFTIKVDGTTKIGPTAIPAFWREQYRGLDRFRLDEFLDITRRSLGLLFHSEFGFTRLAVEELRKYSRRRMVELARELVTDLDPSQFRRWAKPGIRAQLYDLRRRRLEMDFVLEGDARSMHVLNAVSPGWTCSIPFSRYVIDQVEHRMTTKESVSA